MKLFNALIILVLFTYLSFSCKAQIEKGKIEGKWKVVNFIANTPSLSPALLKGAKEEALSSSYSFRKDKSFTMQSEFVTPTENGLWNISAENELIMDYKPGGKQKKEVYKIEQLNGTNMKWSQDMGELGSLVMILKKE